ncbi:uncharacterized protein LOC125706829 [Brienomyrus brachyistius]|uniref:uncharacterized protein LOC125706829 n=1 Tax=Brienomyrus brachyistius TaxID=42636 RepID=UPI0020B26529|nr:uncharacterized protein LOC125706829 [Brienomyrus brachyistius]
MSTTKEEILQSIHQVSLEGPSAEGGDAEHLALRQQAEPSKDTEEAAQDSQHQSETVNIQQIPDFRRSQRIRKLTEKGKELLDAKLNDLKRDFERMYGRWKYHVNGLKRSIKNNDDADLINEVANMINTIQSDVDNIYDKIRDITSPEPEIRRKNDTCHAITRVANEKVRCYLDGVSDFEILSWPDAESVFDTTVSSVISATTSKSRTGSKGSKQSFYKLLQKKHQAAADVAATQEIIKIMKTQHQYEEEIRNLEVEEQRLMAEREVEEREIEVEKARKRAQFISESTARKLRLEEKRKEVEQLKELKRHNVAQARLQVYVESINGDEEESLPPPPSQQSQEVYPTQPNLPVFLPQPVIPTQASSLHPPMFTSVSSPQRNRFLETPTPPSATFATSHESSNDLVYKL